MSGDETDAEHCLCDTDFTCLARHDRYTIPEVAAALNVRPNTVSSYRSRGQMPAPTGYVGRTPWWSPADIQPWIEQQRGHRKHLRNQ